MRPGPSRIARDVMPGGVVLHVYDRTGKLLTESRMGPGIDVAAEGERAAGHMLVLYDVDTVCLVAYDGDSGDRWPTEAWHGRDVRTIARPRVAGSGPDL